MPKKMKLAALSVAMIAALGYAASTAQQPPAAPADTVIQAGRLLADPASGRVLSEQSILVRGGRIVSVTAGYSAPAGAKVVDLRGSFVLPGLIDSHVHLTSEQGPNTRIDTFLKTGEDRAIDG